MKSHRVLIIGCGSLGSRHLQAVASLPTVYEIEVVEPVPEAVRLGRQRLAEIPDLQEPTSVRWISSLSEATDHGDLCIIATQAKGRCEIFRQVADQLGYKAFVWEKIAAQSVTEMEESLGFAKDNGIKVWVNLQTRTASFYRRVKRKLDSSHSVVLSTVGGGQFLAANGIHVADLFAYYDGGQQIESTGGNIDPVLHPSKRSPELYDLTGTLHGSTENGSSLTIAYTESEGYWGHVSIASRNYQVVVDHLNNWAWEAEAASGWQWESVPYEGTLMVSHTTKEIADDILSSGICTLPTLEEALTSHRFILDGLRPHFGRLLGRPVDRCPVT